MTLTAITGYDELYLIRSTTSVLVWVQYQNSCPKYQQLCSLHMWHALLAM